MIFNMRKHHNILRLIPTYSIHHTDETLRGLAVKFDMQHPQIELCMLY